MDFGSGPTSSLKFTLPPEGTIIYRSRAASGTLITGWAVAFANASIQGLVAFREIINGAPKVEITAEATLPSVSYLSPANSRLGVAIANIYGVSLPATIVAIDSNGNQQGQQYLTIPAHGHVAFNLQQQITGLGPDFEGSVKIFPSVPRALILAWTVNADASGTISSLPQGRVSAPASQGDRVATVYWNIFQAYLSSSKTGQTFASPAVQLNISPEARINAFASGGNTVQINYALAELISDSPSELAFIVAHEMGHIYQQRSGQLFWRPDDKEWDADYWGLIMSLKAGYDPYAAAGALAKLAMATNTAGLSSQLWEDFLTPLDAHASFSTRIDNLYNFITTICSSSSEAQNTCSKYKSLYHPHFPTFPGSAPLNDSTVFGPEGISK